MELRDLDERKIPVSMMLDYKYVVAIDRMRGQIARSRYIRDLLAEAIETHGKGIIEADAARIIADAEQLHNG